MGDIVSRGAKVILRQKRLEDAEDDFNWRADPELAELDATVALRLSFTEFLRHFEDELRYPTPWARRYGIEALDGRHIGNCMQYDIDTASGASEVGIMIGLREYWGQGYGRDAMALMVEEAFKMPSMRRLYLHTLEWNGRARKSFASCGFRELRPVRRAARDFILMEVTREEWEAVRGAALKLSKDGGF